MDDALLSSNETEFVVGWNLLQPLLPNEVITTTSDIQNHYWEPGDSVLDAKGAVIEEEEEEEEDKGPTGNASMKLS